MDKKSAKAALNAAIEKVVRSEFEDAAIHAVEVREDTDFDGDEVVRVMIIFESAVKPDARKMAGLARHLWPVVEEKDSRAFPVLYFRSRADHERLGAGA